MRVHFLLTRPYYPTNDTSLTSLPHHYFLTVSNKLNLPLTSRLSEDPATSLSKRKTNPRPRGKEAREARLTPKTRRPPRQHIRGILTRKSLAPRRHPRLDRAPTRPAGKTSWAPRGVVSVSTRRLGGMTLRSRRIIRQEGVRSQGLSRLHSRLSASPAWFPWRSLPRGKDRT